MEGGEGYITVDSLGRLSGGAMQPLEEVRQGESRMYNVGNFTMADWLLQRTYSTLGILHAERFTESGRYRTCRVSSSG